MSTALSQSVFVRYVVDFMILVGAFLLSIAVPFRLFYESPERPTIQTGAQETILIILLALTGVYLLLWTLEQLRAGLHLLTGRFYTVTLSGLLALALLIRWRGDDEPLSLIYFVAFSTVLGLSFGIMPDWLAGRTRSPDLLRHLQRLWNYRNTLKVWTIYSIQAKYNKAFLGILWIILVPMLRALVFAFIFSSIRLRPTIRDVPFLLFLLSGLIPWNLFGDGIQIGANAIGNKMGIINQIYFPREILVVIRLAESLVDLGLMLLTLMVVDAGFGFWPSPLLVYLPFILFIQVCLTLGIMLFLGYLSVLIPDIPEVTGVVVRLIFYMTPITYDLTVFTPGLRQFMLLNPLASIIEAYRGIFLYHEAPDPATLYYPLVLAVTLLYLGYIGFKAHDEDIGDFV